MREAVEKSVQTIEEAKEAEKQRALLEAKRVVEKELAKQAVKPDEEEGVESRNKKRGRRKERFDDADVLVEDIAVVDEEVQPAREELHVSADMSGRRKRKQKHKNIKRFTKQRDA